MRLRGSILYEYLFFKHFASSSKTIYLKKELLSTRILLFFLFLFLVSFPSLSIPSNRKTRRSTTDIPLLSCIPVAHG